MFDRRDVRLPRQAVAHRHEPFLSQGVSRACGADIVEPGLGTRRIDETQSGELLRLLQFGLRVPGGGQLGILFEQYGDLAYPLRPISGLQANEQYVPDPWLDLVEAVTDLPEQRRKEQCGFHFEGQGFGRVEEEVNSQQIQEPAIEHHWQGSVIR